MNRKNKLVPGRIINSVGEYTANAAGRIIRLHVEGLEGEGANAQAQKVAHAGYTDIQASNPTNQKHKKKKQEK
jgi:hypothetical protein